MKRLPYFLIVVLTILILILLHSISQAQTSFNISNKTTGDTLLTIDNSGQMGLGITVPGAGFHIVHTNGALFSGTFGEGSIPVEGAGTRMLWYPAKSAFRVGSVNGTQWDDVNIGLYSMALGRRTTASGDYAQTLGNFTSASGDHSMAFGRGAQASGYNAIAIGRSIEASGDFSFAIGVGEQGGTVVTQDTTLAIIGGRVGIHTVAPTSAFEVADTIYSSFGGFMFPDGSVQETAAGAGLANTLDQAYDQGGAGSGRIITADSGPFEVNGTDGVVFGGNYGSGSIPATWFATGSLMWYPGKSAFRVGRLGASQNVYWSDDSTGSYSVAMGYNTRAVGNNAFASGANTIARGISSTALGQTTKALGDYSFAVGSNTTASGTFSTAMGTGTFASGSYTTAMGINTTASFSAATAMGSATRALGNSSTTMGNDTEAEGAYSIAMGQSTVAYGNYSMAMGQEIEARGSHTFAIGLSDQNGLQVTQDTTMAIMGGNVGIGTIAPTTRLEVADTISSTFGGFKFPDGTVQGTAAGSGGVISINDLSDAIYNNGSVYLGQGAGESDDGGVNENTAVGVNALNLNTSGEYNSAIGVAALNLNTTGGHNTATGAGALFSNTNGWYNTASGYLALYSNTVGTYNVAIGQSALNSNTTGIHNIGLGSFANYYNEEGSFNTTVGYKAGSGTSNHDKSGNVFLGYKAGFNESGNNKLYIENSDTTAPLIGGDFTENEVYINGNLGIGTLTPASALSVGGNGSGLAAISGETTSDVAIWGYATDNDGTGVEGQADGSLGRGVYGAATNSGSVINYGGYFDAGGESGYGVYARATGTTGRGIYGYATGTNGKGVVGNGAVASTSYDFDAIGPGIDYGSTSSIRWKRNIVEINNPLQKITALRGVYFDWDEEHGGGHDLGCIAEEVGAVLPEIVVYEENGVDADGMDYSKLTPLLIEAVKAQQKIIQNLQERIENLENNAAFGIREN